MLDLYPDISIYIKTLHHSAKKKEYSPPSRYSAASFCHIFSHLFNLKWTN